MLRASTDYNWEKDTMTPARRFNTAADPDLLSFNFLFSLLERCHSLSWEYNHEICCGRSPGYFTQLVLPKARLGFGSSHRNWRRTSYTCNKCHGLAVGCWIGGLCWPWRAICVSSFGLRVYVLSRERYQSAFRGHSRKATRVI